MMDLAQKTAHKQVRGSSLLLFGRFLSLGINFTTQVLMVRYLSKSDYGAWAYAFSIVALFQAFSSLGLKHSIGRFVPLYHEKEEYGKLFGTIVLTVATILVMGLISVALVHLFPGYVAKLMNGQNQPMALLFILIFLTPLEALDQMLLALFASFARAKAIFFRKHLLAPLLRLVVVLLLIFFNAGVAFLASGYLVASLIGVFIYGGMLTKYLRQKIDLNYFSWRKLEFPVKAIFMFTIPMLTTELVGVLMDAVGALILGYYHGSEAVASLRVILPAANFNNLVMSSFSLLYMPLATRLFSKENLNGINNLYWHTAIWLGVLSFPLFAITFSMAKPLTLALYGTRYADSFVYLQLLSLGLYFNVVLGFNGLTLKVLGRLRYIVTINLTAVLANIILDLLLIPQLGAMGAALGTAGALIIHNLLKQAGLRLASGVAFFESRYWSHYFLIAACAGGLLLISNYLITSVYINGLLVMVVSLLVLYLSRHRLNIEETFPELQKWPFIKRFLKSRQSLSTGSM